MKGELSIPTPALSGSGQKGIISACDSGHPLIFAAAKLHILFDLTKKATVFFAILENMTNFAPVIKQNILPMTKKQVILRTFAALFLLTATLFLRAASVQYINITVEGRQVSFSLAEHPVITYSHNTLVVKTAAEEVEIPVALVTGYTYSEEPSAIRDLKLAGNTTIGAGLVAFSALTPGSLVVAVNAGGQQVASVTASADGTAVVDLSRQPKGIYVLSAAGNTIKVINK